MCFGFPSGYLSALRQAIETRSVVWKDVNVHGGTTFAMFEWANTRWQLTESYETVNSISLLGALPTEEDLTIALLKGKIKLYN